MRIKNIAAALLLSASAFMVGCDTAATTAPEAESPILTSGVNVRGQIISKAGIPLPGITVRLKNAGLSAVTDAQGVYRITGSATAKGFAGRSAGEAVDSVIVVSGNGSDTNTITKMALRTMVDSLPSLYLIQRNFGGKLTGNTPSDARVVLTLSTVGTNETKKTDLWFNASSQSYSGFVYFVYDGLDHKWATDVKVYNAAGNVVAYAPEVVFPASAGDIEFADLAWNMFVPNVVEFSASFNLHTNLTTSAVSISNIQGDVASSWFGDTASLKSAFNHDTMYVTVSPDNYMRHSTIATYTNLVEYFYLIPDSLQKFQIMFVNGKPVIDEALSAKFEALRVNYVDQYLSVVDSLSEATGDKIINGIHIDTLHFSIPNSSKKGISFLVDAVGVEALEPNTSTESSRMDEKLIQRSPITDVYQWDRLIISFKP